MKVKITYKTEENYTFHYWAMATVNGKQYLGCGDSWESAKRSLIRDIQKGVASRTIEIPPPEEVEIEEAAHAHTS